MDTHFRRDRLTWVAYLMSIWFAFLQASPGLVIVHLREELHLSFAVGGLHVAAFAAGSTGAGWVSARLEQRLGRGRLLWSAAALMGLGAAGLVAGRAAEMTIGAVLVMGTGGGLLLGTIQAALADRHGDHRTVAVAEANVAASIGYLLLIGLLSLTAYLHLGWRAALLGVLALPLLLWGSNRDLRIEAPEPARVVQGRLPAAFWVAAAVLFCTTAAEWCTTAWAATYVGEETGVSSETAVTLMGGYFGGVLLGRTLGSRLARRHDPARLLALALALSAGGFALLWPSTSPEPAVLGLTLLGMGLGNLYPMGMSVALALAPAQSALASGRAVSVSSFASLLPPFTIGAMADWTSLQAAFLVVPVMLALAALGLAFVQSAAVAAEGPAADSAALQPEDGPGRTSAP